MKVVKESVNAKTKVEAFLTGRGYVKTGRTQNFSVTGEVEADFYIYVKGSFEVIVNDIEGVVGVNYGGKQIMGFNKSMVEHIECFKSYMVEMETILVKG